MKVQCERQLRDNISDSGFACREVGETIKYVIR